jgi:DNA polymerase
MPFSLKYFGAHTGRWAGDAGFNMQNLRKDPILLDRKTMRLADKSTKRPLALDIRSLIVPRPGKKLFIADSSQIEPRVLAWLTGNVELMERIREGMSVYEVHARQSLGWEGGSLKHTKKASEKLLYKRAKAEVLALGYGCGAEKYVSAAWAMAKYKVDPEDAVKEVTQFRENNPQIVDLWKHLDAEFKKSINSDFVIGLPSGRELRYEKVGCELRRYKDKETGKPRTKWVYTANVGGRRRIFYGGMLTENLVQAVARDVFAVQMLDVESKAGASTLFSAHDEVVGELDNDVDLCVVEECLSKCPDFLEGCPIGCEAEIAEHYKK